MAVTAVAWLENTRLIPWSPFFFGHVALAIGVPLALGVHRGAGAWRWRWSYLLVAPLLAVLLQVGVGLLAGGLYPLLLESFGVPAAELSQARYSLTGALERMFAAGGSHWQLPPATIRTCYLGGVLVWAGFGEELFYRGYLHRALARGWGVAAGVVLSAALFGLRHATQLALLVPDYPWPAAVLWVGVSFLAGLVFSVLLERTGSLTLPVLVHYLFNLVPFLAGGP